MSAMFFRENEDVEDIVKCCILFETNSIAPNFGTVKNAILSSLLHQKSSKSFKKRLFLEWFE